MPKSKQLKYDEAVSRSLSSISAAVRVPQPLPYQAGMLIRAAQAFERNGYAGVRQHFGLRTSFKKTRAPDTISLTDSEIDDIWARGATLAAARQAQAAQAEDAFSRRVVEVLSTTRGSVAAGGGAKKSGVKAATAAVHRKKGSNARRKATPATAK